MTDLNPDKLHVVYKDSVDEVSLKLPRKYTLTHSDSAGDLFLTIGSDYDFEQISSLYTRFMRDEVLAEWQKNNDQYELHIYMHVSGGFCFGWAGLRDRIFCYHLPLVLQAFKYGDKKLIEEMPEIENSDIIVHFQSKNKKYDRIENFGQIKEIHC
ncbi:MAG: staygreen family protein [Candidatus Lokiarchaeota archaeon]|nr:staygreen family protein [Candidatus Lokiarchaeota archaeon]